MVSTVPSLPPGLAGPNSGPVEPPGPGQPWTVLHMIRWAGEYLDGKGVESGRLNGEHLLAFTLGTKRLDLYLQFDRPLSSEELERFKPLLKRRAGREPLQYIVGTAPFRDLVLKVDQRVLVPRPETEYLLDVLIEEASREKRDAPWDRALDIGTGSGALALALAAEGLAKATVAVDCSADALSLARENGESVGVAARVDFRLGSLLEPVAGEVFDVVVSNPPYVPDEEWASTEPEVREWEPSLALKGGHDGMDVLRALVDGVVDVLAPSGWLALEMAADQTEVVAELVRGTGGFERVAVRIDLAGRPRYVIAQRS